MYTLKVSIVPDSKAYLHSLFSGINIYEDKIIKTERQRTCRKCRNTIHTGDRVRKVHGKYLGRYREWFFCSTCGLVEEYV